MLNIDSVLHVLDYEMSQCDVYMQKKEEKLVSLKTLLRQSVDDHHCFALCNELFEEYKHYQYDSAYVYAVRSLRLAEQLQQPESIALAKSSLIFCYTAVGFYKEADEVNREFSVEGLTPQMLEHYYFQCLYLYQNMRDFAVGNDSLWQHYEYLREQARAQVLMNADKNTDEYQRNHSKDMLSVEFLSPDSMIERRKLLLDKYSLSLHDQAVQYFMIGEMCDKLGRRTEATYYMALSAINDIRSITRETSAGKTLASYMYEAGDIDRATRYIHRAQSDANFYNTRIRKMEINSILPLIESRRYEQMSRQRNFSFAFGAFVLLTLLLLVILYVILKKKNRSLREARNEIEQKARERDAVNRQLSVINMQLQEANEIKDSYIVQSLYGDSSFVNEVEEKCKQMERKLKAKQYDDLLSVIHGINIRQERERMSSSFDAAFLKLFPTFLEEYNKLFPEEYQACLTDSGMLPTEVRIFALMRLGIADTALVAKYLNISQNTIYVYKAKVKAKSLVSKEEFDNRILRICKLQGS
ncbi:hypothetical protein HF895_06190 [Bacteroides sp. AN502]|nr:hypothetical protein [Caecibacteroides pullorum]MDC6279265.1 DUF6377 domain-containing protein [Caecibacteroides pullorum]